MNGTRDHEDDGHDYYHSRGNLRSLFRAEIHSVLRPPKEAAKLAELDRNVKALMSKATTKVSAVSAFKPPPRASAKKPRADVADAGVQAEFRFEPSEETQKRLKEIVEKPIEDAPPEPQKPEPKPNFRNCVYEEQTPTVLNLRDNVKEARAKLNDLDGQVTRLTRELKLCRMDTWKHQRNLAHTEVRIVKLIDEHSQKLPLAEREEEMALEKEERELLQRLSEAKAAATRWSTLAKRQDTMLKQDRDDRKGKDVEKIFARHPAGEVFISPLMFNDDGDDSDYEQSRHRSAPRRGRQPAPPSSDEEGIAGSEASTTVPPPPAQRHRVTLDDDVDESSDGSASQLPTPSESASSAGGSSRPSPLGAAGASPSGSGGKRAGVRATGLSSDESENEAQDKAPAPVQVTEPAPAPKTSPVPPLPALTTAPLTTANLLANAPQNEESYTSDEDIDEELDTSRSI